MIDINECNNTPSPCEDVCTNTEGSYTCSCSDHHETVTEDGQCVGKEILHNCSEAIILTIL